MFYLVKLVPEGEGKFREEPIPDEGPFATGKDAALRQKHLSLQLGVKVQPRRIAQANDDWRSRHAANPPVGSQPLPKDWNLAPISDHFAHRAASNHRLIGFFRNEAEAIINKATATTPGRYLGEFYPDLKDADRRRLVALIDPAGEIQFARTSEEIENVYTTGPHSCMSHRRSNWPSLGGHHPTHAYAAGDLAIAYLTNERGGIMSRAICFPEGKVYGRIYGDCDRLERKFDELGWEQTDEIRGAKVAKMRLDPAKTGYASAYVMPYFDNIDIVIDRGDHFVTGASFDLDDGDRYVGCGGTGGMASMLAKCPGSGPHGSAQIWDEATWKVVQPSGQTWSPRSLQENATQVDGVWWENTHLVTVKMTDKMHSHVQRWTKERFAKEGFVDRRGWSYAKTVEHVEIDGVIWVKTDRDDWEKANAEKPQRVQTRTTKPRGRPANSANRMTTVGEPTLGDVIESVRRAGMGEAA